MAWGSLLLGHRSLRICSLVAPRPRPFFGATNTSQLRDTTLAKRCSTRERQRLSHLISRDRLVIFSPPPYQRRCQRFQNVCEQIRFVTSRSKRGYLSPSW